MNQWAKRPPVVKKVNHLPLAREYRQRKRISIRGIKRLYDTVFTRLTAKLTRPPGVKPVNVIWKGRAA